MADLRESGSIEQDADVIMLLHREEYYHIQNPSWAEENPDKVGLTELIIAKQRNGPTETVKLSWVKRSMRFANYARPRNDAPMPQDEAPMQVKKVGFAPGAKTGPVADHRDGGGSDRGQNAGGLDDVDVPF
jgi:hypothetical protein